MDGESDSARTGAAEPHGGVPVRGPDPQRAETSRHLSASRLTVVAMMVGMLAALACGFAGFTLAQQSDDRHAEAQRAALRAAVGDFRDLFGIGREVDPRSLDLLEHGIGLRDLRFESDPPAGTRETQPVASSAGRIVGFLTWERDDAMTGLMQRFVPLVAGIAFALVAFAAFALGQLRRSRVALSASEEAVRRAAEHDALTGLPNRAGMVRLLEEAMAAREGQAVVVYALIALERMNDIAEAYGQHGCDEIVAVVGARLRECLPASAVCGRIGGEFAVLVRGNDDTALLMQNAIEAVSRPHWIDTVVHLSVHAGFARAPADAVTRDELMRRAEIALRDARKKGPGAIVAFHHAIDVLASDQQFIRRELPRALGAGALELHYQPIVASDGSRFTGVEALLRWTHKDRGAIAPAQFIPVAEQMGLMDALGAFVLRRALTEARRWHGLYIAVNLSPLQVRDRRIVDLVREVLEETGVEPSRLMLEITEGVLIDKPEEMIARIEELHAIGVRIVLDDFGAGYSNLGYLQRFAFDKLKADRSLVSALGRSPNAGVIIQAIVALGRALGVSVLVEGVETEEQRVLLRLAGCDEMQGFLFARPAPARSIDRLVGRRKVARRAAA